MLYMFFIRIMLVRCAIWYPYTHTTLCYTPVCIIYTHILIHYTYTLILIYYTTPYTGDLPPQARPSLRRLRSHTRPRTLHTTGIHLKRSSICNNRTNK